MKESAIIAGVGEGLGAALGRRFARAGYQVALLARGADKLQRIADDIRAQGGKAIALATDVRDPAAVAQAFDQTERDCGPVAAAVFNAGAWHREPVVDTPAEVFEKVWRLACYAGFVVGQNAAKRMLPRGSGTILFTGATASVRGAALFSAFAAAKSGLRSLAQSMARDLGPKGIHVAHVVIDGLIDTPAVRERYGTATATDAQDSRLQPDAIAETYFQLHAQPRSAWTQELDMRPWAEKF